MDFPREASSKILFHSLVAEANPRLDFKDSLTYVSGDLFDMRSTITLQVQEKLQTIADIFSTQKQRPLTNNEVLEMMADIVLEKVDPIRKAQRAATRKEAHHNRKANEDMERRRQGVSRQASEQMRRRRDDSKKDDRSVADDGIKMAPEKATQLNDETPRASTSSQETPQKKFGTCRIDNNKSEEVNKEKSQTESGKCEAHSTKREKISAALIHAVNLRDQRQCTHIGEYGERCPNRRWLETHHIIQVSEGGTNTLENLTTLCSAHHRAYHVWSYH